MNKISTWVLLVSMAGLALPWACFGAMAMLRKRVLVAGARLKKADLR